MSDPVSFVHKFLPVYGRVVGCTFPFAITGVVVDLKIADYPFKGISFLAGVLAFSALLVTLVTRMEVKISREGLYGYDASGFQYHFVKWNEMSWVRPTRWMLGLPYLRVGINQDRNPICLPMFLVDMPRFTRLVSSYVGAAHPVTVALVNYPRAA